MPTFRTVARLVSCAALLAGVVAAPGGVASALSRSAVSGSVVAATARDAVRPAGLDAAASAGPGPAELRSLGLGTPGWISCPTTGFCLAAGKEGRSEALYGSAHGPILDVPIESPIVDVTCATESFCVAIGTHQAAVYDGFGWGPSAPVGPALSGSHDQPLSCASPTFCAVIGDDGVWWHWDGTTWTGQTGGPALPEQATSWALSCASASFCMAEGERRSSIPPADSQINGRIFRFDGAAWTQTARYSGGEGGESSARVSCVSARYCLASEVSDLAEWDGNRWTLAPGGVPPAGDYFQCFALRVCLATTRIIGSAEFEQGRLFRYEGDGWSDLGLVPANSDSRLACSTPDNCTAITEFGFQRRWSGLTGWIGPYALSNAVRDATAVSCAPGPHCVMIDSSGRLSTWDGTTWSRAAYFAYGSHPTSISCVSATHCVVVDTDGQAWMLGDLPDRVDSRRLNEVSCVSEDFCVAVDESGYVVRYEDGVWHTPTLRNPPGPLRGVSCTSETFCMAVGDGNVIRYLGAGQWTAPYDLAHWASSVSCTSTTFCMVRTGPYVRTWDGHGFTAPVRMYFDDRNVPNTVSCAAPQYCVTVTKTDDHRAVVQEWDGATRTSEPGVNQDVGWLPASCWAPRSCVYLGPDYTALQTEP